jgi:protocatechuate 3,4-dioxygenase alpha subunit
VSYEVTPSQTVGPFFGFALRYEGGGEAVPPSSPGALAWEGRVVDGAGAPVPDALLEVWVPVPGGEVRFARCATDTAGRFRLVVTKPAPGSPGRPGAPHLEVTVFARGLLRQLITRLYFPDEQAANAADPVLAGLAPERRGTLIARVGSGGGLNHDIRLQGEGETVFFAF